MPLSNIQLEIARLLATNRTPDSYLAGGAALHISPNSRRYSNDLDFFQDSSLRVSTAFAEDKQVLDDASFTTKILITQPGFISALIEKGGASTRVEWAHDTAWRFLPPIKNETVGYTLHPIDLALNKLLALVGRDEPRDFLDILDILDKPLSLGALCWAASGKDPGYTPDFLLTMLQRRGKYRETDFTRLHLKEKPDLQTLKQQWLSALEEARAFIGQRNSKNVGCLYYSNSKQHFVSEFDEDHPDISLHFGSPGGIIPHFASHDNEDASC